MFEKLRKPKKAKRQGRLKTLFSYIIFGTICLVFVFLSPMGGQIFGEGVVAYVGSEPIRSREFRFFEENLKSQYQERLNTGSAEEIQQLQNKIRHNALQQLINMYLISQAAEDAGFLVSDQELQDEIKAYSVFQNKGRFVYSQYLSFLKSQNLTASRFENRIRRFKTTQNWRQLFLKSVFSNSLENTKNLKRNLFQIKVRFAKIPLSDIKMEEIQPLLFAKDLNQLNQFFRKNKISWKTEKEMPLAQLFNLPSLRERDFIESIIDYLPNKGLISKLLMKGNQGYIVEILSFREGVFQKDNKDFMLTSFLDYEKSERLFDQWVNNQKEKFPIQKVLEI